MVQSVGFYKKGDHFIPVVVTVKSSGEVDQRDLVYTDLKYIQREDDPVKGSWIMRANANATSWTRRYALVRGKFLFYFVTASSFGSSKPEGVLPLENTEVQVPANNAMTFERRNVHQHNSGYEFDIAHPTRGTMRFASPTDDGREEMAEFCYYRSEIDDSLHAVNRSGIEGDENLVNRSIRASFKVGQSTAPIYITSYRIPDLEDEYVDINGIVPPPPPMSQTNVTSDNPSVISSSTNSTIKQRKSLFSNIMPEAISHQNQNNNQNELNNDINSNYTNDGSSKKDVKFTKLDYAQKHLTDTLQSGKLLLLLICILILHSINFIITILLTIYIR
jgi:hypothetical protein